MHIEHGPRVVVVLLRCAVIAALSSAGWMTASGAPPCSTPQLRRLIRDLTAKSFETRFHAGAELAKLGGCAIPALRDAFLSGKPEVRLRVAEVVSDIQTPVGDEDLAVFVHGMHDPENDVHFPTRGIFLRAGARGLPLLLRELEQHPASASMIAETIESVAGDRSGFVSPFRKRLREADPPWSIISALGAIGPAAQAALPELTDLLNRGVWLNKLAATFAGIGPASKPYLVPALAAGNTEIRDTAFNALLWLRASDPRMVPLILQRVRGSGAEHYLAALADVGPPADIAVPEIIPWLSTPEAEARPAAADAAAEEALRCIGVAGEPWLHSYLATDDPSLLAAVLRVYSTYPRIEDDVAPQVSSAFGHPALAVRNGACAVARAFPLAFDSEAVRLANSGKVAVAVRMVDCLGEAAPHGVSIARAALSSTQDVVLRSQAAHALVRAAAGTEHERDAIKTVLALAQRDPEILDALAAKATHDGAVLLATRLNDPEPSVAAGAARALRGLAGTATVAELVPILATADFPLAARLLVLGTRPYSEQLQTAASTAMAEAFRESSPEQRDMALALATRYSEPATALYPQIRTFLGDADVSTRIHAIEALGNACTEGAREDLLRVLGADAAAERAAAATALKMRYRLPRNTEFPWKIWDLRTCIPFTAEYERETTRVADALVRQLSSDPNEAVRLAAADALANVSCCSAELGAQLLQRLPSETSPDVRSLIWTALSWSYGVDFVFLRDASAVARIETDASVGQYAVHALRVIEDRLTPPGVVEATLGRPPEPGSVTPLFPLPPPSFTAFARVPAELLGTANTELATVHGRLLRAFEYLGFPEPAVFQTPGGFALVTNVERIAADGTPMYGRDRFTAGKVPLAKFAPEEWMKRFFFGDERQFRLTVVVLAPEKLRGPSLTITEDAAREWIQHGGTALPAAVATTRLVAVSPVVLFYHFAKTGGTVQLIPETKTPLPGSVHLQKLALLAALERTYP